MQSTLDPRTMNSQLLRMATGLGELANTSLRARGGGHEGRQVGMCGQQALPLWQQARRCGKGCTGSHKGAVGVDTDARQGRTRVKQHSRKGAQMRPWAATRWLTHGHCRRSRGPLLTVVHMHRRVIGCCSMRPNWFNEAQTKGPAKALT